MLKSFIEVPKVDPHSGRQIMGPDGKPIMGIMINPIKPHVRTYWLAPDTVAVALAASGSQELRFLIDSQGHFDWTSILGVSTGQFTLEWYDPGTSRRLQNRPPNSNTIVGSAVRKFNLVEPYFFNVGDSQRQLICTIRDISGAPNTVRLVITGRRFYHKEAPPDVALDIAKKFGYGWRTYNYFLVPNEVNNDGTIPASAIVPALGSFTFTFESDASADTEIHKLTSSSTGAFTFTIRERSTNRLLMNDVVHSNNGWGNAEFPFYFADPYLLERQKQLLVTVTDLTGSPNTVYLTMTGRRLQLIP